MEKVAINKKKPLKKLTEEDINALQKILGNVTVTQSGMIRNMSFLVLNPALEKKVTKLVTEIKKLQEKYGRETVRFVMNEL